MHIHYLSRSTLISDSANAVHVMKMCDATAGIDYKVTLHAYAGEGKAADIPAYYDTKHPFSISLHNEHKSGLSGFLWALRRALPFLRVGGLPSFLYAWQRIRPVLKREADMVFSRNIYWMPAIPKNIPFIFESHTPPQNALQKWVEGKLYARPSCCGIVVISEKMREIYETIFPEHKNKFIVAHDGADDPAPTLEDIKERVARPLKNIGYVGQLYQGRGVEIIIESARALPHLTFHIVGGKPEMIEGYKNAGAPDNIIFHGHQPHSALPDFYRTFDAVLAPYQRKVSVAGDAGDTSAFMSPLKIFEYMSWGLPILCSDMPVLREVLEDNYNALLITPDNAQDWVRALEKLRDEPDARFKIGENARKDFIKCYTWKERARTILMKAAAINHVMAEDAHARPRSHR